MAKKQARKKAARGGSRSSGAVKRTGGRKAAAKKTSRAARGAKKKTVRKTTARRRAGAGSATGRAGGRGGQVSRSTRSAVWIDSPNDLEQQPGKTLATRSHEVIQRWAEERDAEPATIPGGDASEPRVLRLNFPGFGGQNLQAVAWDDWFQTFDDRNLVFVFQERLKNGNQSNFFRLDNPGREDA